MPKLVDGQKLFTQEEMNSAVQSRLARNRPYYGGGLGGKSTIQELNDEYREGEDMGGGEEDADGEIIPGDNARDDADEPEDVEDDDQEAEEEPAAEENPNGETPDEVFAMLKHFGYEGTPEEIRKQVAKDVELDEREKELADLQEEADRTGANPDLLKRIKDLEKTIETLSKKTEEDEVAKVQNAEDRQQIQQEVADLRKAFPKMTDAEYKALDGNKAFLGMIRNSPSLTLTEVYRNYRAVVKDAQRLVNDRRDSKRDRVTGGGSDGGGTYGLSLRQQKMARDNDMPYKQYAAYLHQVPSRSAK
jgi:hypothetical protein